MTDVLVSIVHYNTPELLKRCLASLAAEGSPLAVKVVVVDNASTPPLSPADLMACPGAVLVSNRRNVGFGAANNQAFSMAPEASCALVLNPDVEVSPGSFSFALDAFRRRPDVGILGPALRYPDGGPQVSRRRYPTLRSVLLRGFLSERRAQAFSSVRRLLMADVPPDAAGAVDWLLGSSLFIRREALSAVGGFDPDYFMYYEDIDLCHRANGAGWKVWYEPGLSWVHDYRRQSARRGQYSLRLRHFTSALRFLVKRGKRDGWRRVL